MDLKEFHKSIEDIVLYPGGLDELNILEQATSSGRTYELMPQKEGVRYLTGIIIPKPSEFKERMTAMQSVTGTLSKNNLGLALHEDGMNEMTGMLGQIMTEIYQTPELMNIDIRLKAKKIGADGLIHFQLYDKDAIYMGIPVKLKE